jgi:hypothetical protein
MPTKVHHTPKAIAGVGVGEPYQAWWLWFYLGFMWRFGLLIVSACAAEVVGLARPIAPPAESPAPTAGVACQAAVGRMPARRLSKVEYNQTVATVFQFGLFPFAVGDVAARLPDDVAGANGLQVNDAFLEAHEAIAFDLANRAIAAGAVTNCATQASTPRPCVEQVIKPFLERAWRRTASQAEVDRLTAYVDVVALEPTQPIHDAIVLGMVHALMSPQFLFRFESLPAPNNPSAQALTASALADRLSYFIYGSGPDAPLRLAAASGALLADAELERQVDRMLESPRSRYLLERLANRWLWTNRVDVVNPEASRFPNFDGGLRQSLKAETHALLRESLAARTPFADMLDVPHTFVDARLAAHYGLWEAQPTAEQPWLRVDLSRHPLRGGLLTHGSLLAATSSPLNAPTAEVRETNVIIRGKFVLKQLACAEFETPSGIDFVAIQNQAQMAVSATAPRKVREAVRQERADCASCHSVLDPIGYSMESFDITGAQRTVDTVGVPVDTTGVLKANDGSELGAFSSARDLATLLKRDERLSPCLARHLVALAVEHEIHEEDACRATQLAASAKSGSLRDLILAVVRDDSFRQQEGEQP